MLSSTTKYALKALAFLRQSKSKNFVSVDELAEKLDIPRQYLAKIMKTLAIKGVVISKKGPHGGIKLKDDKRKRTLLDLCILLDDPVSKELCFLGRRGCDAKNKCIFHDRWFRLRTQIRQFLSTIKIT